MFEDHPELCARWSHLEVSNFTTFAFAVIAFAITTSAVAIEAFAIVDVLQALIAP